MTYNHMRLLLDNNLTLVYSKIDLAYRILRIELLARYFTAGADRRAGDRLTYQLFLLPIYTKKSANYKSINLLCSHPFFKAAALGTLHPSLPDQQHSLLIGHQFSWPNPSAGLYGH